MKAWVIAIRGLPFSEQLAARCIRSAAEFGQLVRCFPAVDRYAAPAAMTLAELQLNRRIYASISDVPVGDRDTIPRGNWWLTTPELGCFMSHFNLWKRCVDLNEPILVLEHDAVVLAPVPVLPEGTVALELCRMDQAIANTAAYIISPAAAKLALAEAFRHGIQPVDELLWRTALKRQPTGSVAFAVVRHESGGISTIQFSRNDTTHRFVADKNPWDAYQNPAWNKE